MPPPPSMSRPGNPNTIPLVSRFSSPGTSSLSFNRFQSPSGVETPAVTVNRQGYSTLNVISQNAIANTTYGVPTNKPKTEDE